MKVATEKIIEPVSKTRQVTQDSPLASASMANPSSEDRNSTEKSFSMSRNRFLKLMGTFVGAVLSGVSISGEEAKVAASTVGKLWFELLKQGGMDWLMECDQNLMQINNLTNQITYERKVIDIGHIWDINSLDEEMFNLASNLVRGDQAKGGFLPTPSEIEELLKFLDTHPISTTSDKATQLSLQPYNGIAAMQDYIAEQTAEGAQVGHYLMSCSCAQLKEHLEQMPRQINRLEQTLPGGHIPCFLRGLIEEGASFIQSNSAAQVWFKQMKQFVRYNEMVTASPSEKASIIEEQKQARSNLERLGFKAKENLSAEDHIKQLKAERALMLKQLARLRYLQERLESHEDTYIPNFTSLDRKILDYGEDNLGADLKALNSNIERQEMDPFPHSQKTAERWQL